MSSRSRSYPVINLEDSCHAARHDLLPLATAGYKTDRDGVADLLHYASGSGGAAARKIAALTSYGVLDRHGGLYSLSILGRKLQSLPKDSREYLNAARTAFLNPPLFRDLVAAVRMRGGMPNDLPRLLEEQHRITPKASRHAASVFIQSAEYAGLLSGGDLADPPDKGLSSTNSISVHPASSTVRAGQQGTTSPKHPLAFDRSNNELQYRVLPIGLPEGEALIGLALPQETSRKSAGILRQHIKVILKNLEQYFELNDGSKVLAKTSDKKGAEVLGFPDSEANKIGHG